MRKTMLERSSTRLRMNKYRISDEKSNIMEIQKKAYLPLSPYVCITYAIFLCYADAVRGLPKKNFCADVGSCKRPSEIAIKCRQNRHRKLLRTKGVC